MDTFFDPYDPLYAWLGLGWFAFDHFVLRRRLPGMTWHWLRLPSTLLHELTHFLVALALGANARITSLRPRQRPDGSVELGECTFAGPAGGHFGHVIIKLAPLAWFPLAAVLARYTMSEPRSLQAGLGLLACVLVMIRTAQMTSDADLRGTHLFGVLAVVMLLTAGLQHAVLGAKWLFCASFGLNYQ